MTSSLGQRPTQQSARQRRFHESLAAVDGVITPSKLAPGEDPKQRITDTGGDRRFKCPICGSLHKAFYHLQCHFISCVKTNGNPTGARCNDAKASDTKALTTSRVIAPQKPRGRRHRQRYHERPVAPQSLQSERQRRYHERLAAVNGVVIPSKLAPGQIPRQKITDTSADGTYACPICGSLYKRQYHVQSHFAHCVENNGNPTGARYDDVWNGAASRAEVQVSMVPPSPQTQEQLHPEGHEVANIGSDGSLMDHFTLHESYQHDNEPQSAVTSPSNPDGFEHYNSDFQYPAPEPMISLTSYLRQNDAYPRMRNWANEAFLSKEQGGIYYGQGTFAMYYPHI